MPVYLFNIKLVKVYLYLADSIFRDRYCGFLVLSAINLNFNQIICAVILYSYSNIKFMPILYFTYYIPVLSMTIAQNNSIMVNIIMHLSVSITA